MIKKMLIKLYCRVRFGKVERVVKESINGVEAEVAICNAKGKMVGYWAYGWYDPRLPFQEWCEQGVVYFKREEE